MHSPESHPVRSGFSGISANFYPQLLAWITANPAHEKAEYVQHMLAVCENVVMYKYPTCAKAYLNMFEGFNTEVTTRTRESLAAKESLQQRLQPSSSR